MNNQKVYILSTSLAKKFGGRTKSLLLRSKVLLENDQELDLTICSVAYNPNYNKIYNLYNEKKYIDSKVKYLNIYDYYRNKDSKNTLNNYKTYIELVLKEKGVKELKEFKKKKNSLTTYYYNQGIPLYHITKKETEDHKEIIGNIDFYRIGDSRSFKRLYINDKGNIHRIRYFNIYNNEIQRDVFLDDEFRVYLTKEYVYKNGEQKIKKIILFDKNETKVFNNETQFFTYWYNEFLNDGDTLINDVRKLDSAVINIEKDVKKIYQFHNTHLEPEQSKIREEFKKITSHDLEDNEYIVVLTDQQKEDLENEKIFPSDKIIKIPHFIETRENIDIDTLDIQKRIVVVMRLEKTKRVDDIIKAYKKVFEKYNDYTLEIYGSGTEEESLRELIKNIGFDPSKILKGRVDGVNKIFQTSSFSVISSKIEGFSLACLESVVNGCPVISYDIKYGPREIIGKTGGRLTNKITVDDLADEMINEIEIPTDRKQVLKIKERYTKEKFVKSWFDLIQR